MIRFKFSYKIFDLRLRNNLLFYFILNLDFSIFRKVIQRGPVDTWRPFNVYTTTSTSSVYGERPSTYKYDLLEMKEINRYLISMIFEIFSTYRHVLATLLEKWKNNFPCLKSRTWFCCHYETLKIKTQKKSLVDVLQSRCSWVFRNLYRKTPANLFKRDSNTGVFLWKLLDFYKHLLL